MPVVSFLLGLLSHLIKELDHFSICDYTLINEFEYFRASLLDIFILGGVLDGFDLSFKEISSKIDIKGVTLLADSLSESNLSTEAGPYLQYNLTEFLVCIRIEAFSTSLSPSIDPVKKRD